jgi:hypothetical protein
MGNSNSKSSQSSSTKIKNIDLNKTLNKTVMNTGVETLVKNASSCSSAINQNNTCSMTNAEIGGDFNFGGSQSNKASVNFSCIQASTVSSDMATSMMQSMLAEMDTLNGTDAAAQLNSAANSSNKSGFGSTGGSASSSSSNSTNTNITNDTKNIVRNIYEQNLNNNFTSETVQECIGKTTQSNVQDLSGIKVGGSANVECNQSNTLEQVQECKQMAEAISKTTNDTLQELGIETESSSNVKTKSDSVASTTSENVSTGPIQDFGNAISGIIGSFGNLFGLGLLGSILPCICCFIIILVLFFVIF